ncbi:MAG: phenylalanine--tRNA ligase subunit beta [Verrucomicrobiales bacterium]|nr:phenylalanine--tRNA ligase subunit beta [Verrucomicrobiales bacterium]
MKTTLNWLKDYVAFDWSPEELTERLTMLGLEVEGVDRRGGDFAGVVVAQVVTREKHPNADKLSVCRVNDGKGERQIVCGAQNFQAGDKVPMILPGSALPLKEGDKEPFVIKVGKIRGVESHGMMCSSEELGIDPVSLGLKKEDGLLILDPKAAVGQPFAEYLGRGGADVVYDLEVTPNRPDFNSVIGIAREIAALTGNALKVPAATLPSGDGDIAQSLAVRIDAPDLCPRYTARLIRGVKVGPSPGWLRDRLEKVGLRSINNVVDVTNFVMLETGQPLHAFDYRLIASGGEAVPTIVVRRAVDGEKFVTLDGKEHILTSDHLLIADPVKAVALGGVMGGRNTEVSEQTTDILLETAYFKPSGIRKASKTLGLRTDASYRFERGVDPEATEQVSQRAAQLILELAGGRLVNGVIDAHPAPTEIRQITLRHDRVNALLGLTLRPEEIECYLASLGLRVVNRRPRPVDDAAVAEPITFQVPSYRVDLKREADLIEEVARLYGVDKIPSTTPRYAKGQHAFDTRYDELAEARRLLTGLGLNEAQGQTLVSKGSLRGRSADSVVLLSNPLSGDMDALRPSLVPGLMDILRHNARRKNADIGLFEVGRVFVQQNGGVREGWRLAVALTGARSAGFWSGADRDAGVDLMDLKGLLEEFLEHFGLRGLTWTRREGDAGWYVESAAIQLGGKVPLGELGQVQPRVAKSYDLRGPVYVAELDLDALLAKRNTSRGYRALPAFPAIRRDIAMWVAESITHDAVMQAVRQAKAANLEAVEIFDVFRGKNVPEGQKSVAYALIYRSAERTLTDAEVNAAHEKVVAHLKQSVGAQIRE